MAKCSLTTCSENAVGGFQEVIDAGNFQEPNATIPGGITAWCVTHESDLRRTVAGKPGKWLKATAPELTT